MGVRLAPTMNTGAGRVMAASGGRTRAEDRSGSLAPEPGQADPQGSRRTTDGPIMTLATDAAHPNRPEPAPEAAAAPARGPVLLFGTPAAPALAAVREAAQQARLGFQAQTDLGDADRGLEHGHPSAIVIDAPVRAAEQACLHFRY